MDFKKFTSVLEFESNNLVLVTCIRKIIPQFEECLLKSNNNKYIFRLSPFVGQFASGCEIVLLYIFCTIVYYYPHATEIVNKNVLTIINYYTLLTIAIPSRINIIIMFIYLVFDI